MAPMNTPPAPALNRAVLHTLGHARIHQGAPLTNLWRALSHDLNATEAEALGRSLGLVLRLLVGDSDRIRLAADLAVAIDAYEVAGSLVDLLDDYPDQQLALAAAALAANPAVPSDVVRALRSRRVVREMPHTLRHAFDLRLDAAAPAETDQQNLLRLQRWPGIDPEGYGRAPLAPVVAIAEEGLPQNFVWRLVTDLRNHGAVIRRIPRTLVTEPGPGWLGPSIPIIATSSTVLDGLRQRGQHVTGQQVVVADLGSIATGKNTAEIISAVDRLLRHFKVPRLRDLDSRLVSVAGEAETLDHSIFRLGSYSAGELAYLAGTRIASVHRWGREIDALAPVEIEGFSYWGFNHWLHYVSTTG